MASRIRQCPQQCEELIPCPLGLLQRTLAGQEIGEKLMQVQDAPCEIERRVVGYLLDEQVMARGVGNADARILQDELERGRAWLLIHELRAGDVEHFHGEADTGAQVRIRPEVPRRAGEANQRPVLPGLP